jgi:hypothetical protein
MGYAYCTSLCFGCGQLFSFNPVRVPSIRVRGNREPVCETCVARVNPERIKNGLAPIVPHPDAYQPCNEEELS